MWFGKNKEHQAERDERRLSAAKSAKTNAVEMLSFGGIRFASGIYMAFLSYYLMVFCTDVALIPAAATAVLLLFNRIFNVVANVTLQALGCLRREGMAVLLSVTGPEEVSIPLEALIMNPNVTLSGLVEGGSNPQAFIPELVRYYKEGRLPVDKLVTFYDFKDIEKAFEDSHTGKAIKPVLRF